MSEKPPRLLIDGSWLREDREELRSVGSSVARLVGWLVGWFEGAWLFRGLVAVN